MKTVSLYSVLLGTLIFIGAGCGTQVSTNTQVNTEPTQLTNEQDQPLPQNENGNTPKQEGENEKPPAPAQKPSSGNSGSPATPPPSSGSSGTNVNTSVGGTVTTTPPAEPKARVIMMTARQWVFDPAEVRVKKGEKVTLRITSIDVRHGIAIPAFNVNADLVPDETVEVTFVADRTGSFPYICSVFCGSGHGSMKGTLIVE